MLGICSSNGTLFGVIIDFRRDKVKKITLKDSIERKLGVPDYVIFIY